jgi:hypothetical protein
MESPRPTLVHHFRLLRGVGGKMSAVISAVDHEGEEERRESMPLFSPVVCSLQLTSLAP